MESPLRARPLSVAEPTLTGVGEANAIEESKETVIARGRVTFMLVETVKIGNEWSGEVQGAKCCYNRRKSRRWVGNVSLLDGKCTSFYKYSS